MNFSELVTNYHVAFLFHRILKLNRFYTHISFYGKEKLFLAFISQFLLELIGYFTLSSSN